MVFKRLDGRAIGSGLTTSGSESSISRGARSNGRSGGRSGRGGKSGRVVLARVVAVLELGENLLGVAEAEGQIRYFLFFLITLPCDALLLEHDIH